MSEVPELTLRQILESKVYRDGARLAMWVSPLLFAGCGWLLNDIRTNTVDAVAEIRDTVSTVVDTQADRASDNERFQAEMLKFQQVSVASDERQAEILVKVREDIATIRGVLQAQQREARALIPDWAAAMPLPSGQ